MVPLDRAMLSSYRLSLVTIPLSVTVCPEFCNANFDWVFRQLKSPLLLEDRGPLLTQCYLGPHKCPCQMAFHSVQRL